MFSRVFPFKVPQVGDRCILDGDVAGDYTGLVHMVSEGLPPLFWRASAPAHAPLPMQDEEARNTIAQRVTALGADAEKAMFNHLFAIAELSVRIADGVRDEIRKLGGVEDARLETEFPSGETVAEFALRQGLSSPIHPVSIRRLCESVILSKPMRVLIPLLDALAYRLSGSSRLFLHFPEHMTVRLSFPRLASAFLT